jgi:hypothetical protein
VEEETEEAKIAKLLAKPYKYGFKTIIESDVFPKGLSEDVVRAISAKKEEPEWLLEFRCVAPAGGRAEHPVVGAIIFAQSVAQCREIEFPLVVVKVGRQAPGWLAGKLSRSPCPDTPTAAVRRLKAYRKWLTMEEPSWSDNRYPAIDYQGLSYYSAPKTMEKKKSLDEVGTAAAALSESSGRT